MKILFMYTLVGLVSSSYACQTAASQIDVSDIREQLIDALGNHEPSPWFPPESSAPIMLSNIELFIRSHREFELNDYHFEDLTYDFHKGVWLANYICVRKNNVIDFDCGFRVIAKDGQITKFKLELYP